MKNIPTDHQPGIYNGKGKLFAYFNNLFVGYFKKKIQLFLDHYYAVLPLS